MLYRLAERYASEPPPAEEIVPPLEAITDPEIARLEREFRERYGLVERVSRHLERRDTGGPDAR